jgi:hypothetical protein
MTDDDDEAAGLERLRADLDEYSSKCLDGSYGEAARLREIRFWQYILTAERTNN